ncbi:hypothetical protein VF21_06342 [Pseudogymnoascus sp. 05NY08]|nr:hypothetical protein VF21_06342 [Pseudogymnoascus sp. 05NY08]
MERVQEEEKRIEADRRQQEEQHAEAERLRLEAERLKQELAKKRLMDMDDPVKAKGYADAWLRRYTPQKKFDSVGLRFRRLTCERRFNKDATKMPGSPIEALTLQKKPKVPRKPRKVKAQEKRVLNVVDKPVNSNDQTDDDKEEVPDEQPKDRKKGKRKLLDPYDSDESDYEENPDNTMRVSDEEWW